MFRIAAGTILSIELPDFDAKICQTQQLYKNMITKIQQLQSWMMNAVKNVDSNCHNFSSGIQAYPFSTSFSPSLQSAVHYRS